MEICVTVNISIIEGLVSCIFMKLFTDRYDIQNRMLGVVEDVVHDFKSRMLGVVEDVVHDFKSWNREANQRWTSLVV